MKLLMTGVTGAAGSQMYRSALADSSDTNITVLSRRPLPDWMDVPSDGRTDVVVMPDFMSYPADLSARLAGHDACIWALGKSSQGMSEEEYSRMTYGYVLAAVEALKAGGVAEAKSAQEPFRFVYVSGEGADPEEKSLMMFGRIKGRTEKALTDLPPSTGIKASILRPAYFFPALPAYRQNIRGAGARAADVVLGPVFSRLLPSMYTPVEGMGRLAVELAKGRWGDETLFRNVRMRELIKTLGDAGASQPARSEL